MYQQGSLLNVKADGSFFGRSAPDASDPDRFADGLATERSIVQDVILDAMDHLEVLREKVATLRAEIVQLQELNKQYRRQQWQDTEAQVAHGERQQRLLEIQQELTQIAGLGGRLRSVEQMKEQHRSRPYLVKKAS